MRLKAEASDAGGSSTGGAGGDPTCGGEGGTSCGEPGLSGSGNASPSAEKSSKVATSRNGDGMGEAVVAAV